MDGVLADFNQAVAERVTPELVVKYGENIDQITPASNGEYWVIVTDDNGCVSDTVFYNVTWVPSSIRDLNLEKFLIENAGKKIYIYVPSIETNQIRAIVK